MSRLKRIVVALALVFALPISASTMANASDPNAQISFEGFSLSSTQLGQVGYMVYGALSIQAGLPIAMNGKQICNQPDEACLNAGKMLHLNGYFKECTQTTNSPCVQSIEARTAADQPWIKGVFTEEISYRPNAYSISEYVKMVQNSDPGSVASGMDLGIGWPYQAQSGLPASAEGPLVFKIPGVTNAGGTDTYVVDSRFEIDGAIDNGKVLNANIGNLVMSIRPTRVEAPPSNGFLPVRGLLTRPDGTIGVSGATGGTIDSSYISSTSLGKAMAFGNQQTEFRLNVLLPKTTVGWFHGRLIDPDIKISNFGTNQIAVSMSGKPTQIPVTSTWLPYQTAKTTNPNLINPHWTKDIIDRLETGKTTAGDEWNSWSGLDDRFMAWFPLLPQKAKGTANLWMVNNLPAYQTNSPCFKNAGQLVGLLTTNAMAYQAGPPTFTNGFLNYRVAGVHNDVSGQVYSGTYDLIIKSEVARCLYGFNQAPISATISVVDTENGASTATTLMSENDGWVKFAAKNFTFSTKDVKVQISQPRYVTISGFSSNKANILPATKASIKKAISTVGATITCVSYYSSASSKALATARATNACAMAKFLAGQITTEVLTFSTKLAKQNGQVQVARH